jgi:hypothetical protein
MYVRTQVTSVNKATIKVAALPQQQLGSLYSFCSSESYLLPHIANMSDPPYALFVLDKSITNEVSTAGYIKHVPDTNNHSISTPPLSAPTMATGTRAGASGSRPIPTTTCPHAPKFTSPLQTPAALSPPSHPPSSRTGSVRRPKTAQSGCRRCRAPSLHMRRSMSSTRL